MSNYGIGDIVRHRNIKAHPDAVYRLFKWEEGSHCWLVEPVCERLRLRTQGGALTENVMDQFYLVESNL